jgi:hypothetical protein
MWWNGEEGGFLIGSASSDQDHKYSYELRCQGDSCQAHKDDDWQLEPYYKQTNLIRFGDGYSSSLRALAVVVIATTGSSPLQRLPSASLSSPELGSSLWACAATPIYSKCFASSNCSWITQWAQPNLVASHVCTNMATAHVLTSWFFNGTSKQWLVIAVVIIMMKKKNVNLLMRACWSLFDY